LREVIFKERGEEELEKYYQHNGKNGYYSTFGLGEMCCSSHTTAHLD